MTSVERLRQYVLELRMDPVAIPECAIEALLAAIACAEEYVLMDAAGVQLADAYDTALAKLK